MNFDDYELVDWTKKGKRCAGFNQQGDGWQVTSVQYEVEFDDLPQFIASHPSETASDAFKDALTEIEPYAGQLGFELSHDFEDKWNAATTETEDEFTTLPLSEIDPDDIEDGAFTFHFYIDGDGTRLEA